MEEKKFQFLFTKEIEGNLMIPLKDGKIIFYYFREDYNIFIYNEKTFQKLFEIDLISKIKQLNEEKEYFFNLQYGFDKNKNSIKELDNGIILLGLYKYLLELKLYKNSYDLKIIKKFDDIILDINELSDKRIIVLTTNDIIEINENNKEYNIKVKYTIKENWKMIAKSLTNKYYKDFNQYFYSNVLPNHKLLLKSFSTEYYLFRRCNRSPYPQISNSKFVLIDLKNFEEISSTETFENYNEYIVLENGIIIQSSYHLIIYDINTLKLIKDIYFPNLYGHIHKFNNQQLLVFSEDEEKKKVIKIYKIDNNDLIELCRIKTYLSIDNNNNHIVELFDYNKCLCKMRDKRIIVLCYNRIYILSLNID